MGFERTVGAVLRSPFVPQRLRMILSKPNAEDLLALAGMLEARRITPVVERTFPLDAAADAIEHVGGRNGRGKTVVTV
jgi:NADPH:quinone reductase-like Zn-dependent oxidoreductase